MPKPGHTTVWPGVITARAIQSQIHWSTFDGPRMPFNSTSKYPGNQLPKRSLLQTGEIPLIYMLVVLMGSNQIKTIRLSVELI